MSLLPEQQTRALEVFGDAWMRLRQIEQAVAGGDGASFSHHQALVEMQTRAKELVAVLQGGAVHDLLAVMHRDGGQHTHQHGVEQSARDALRRHYSLLRRLDQAEYAVAERDAILGGTDGD